MSVAKEKSHEAGGQAQEPIKISNDHVGSLFQRRWEQECQTSLFLANENRELHAKVQLLTAEVEKIKGMISHASAEAKSPKKD